MGRSVSDRVLRASDEIAGLRAASGWLITLEMRRAEGL